MKAKTGPFEEAKQQEQQDAEEEQLTVEIWYTPGKISTGYSLLYSILMEPEGTGIVSMEEDHLQLGNLPIRCWALDVCTKVRFELCIGVMEATIW